MIYEMVFSFPGYQLETYTGMRARKRFLAFQDESDVVRIGNGELLDSLFQRQAFTPRLSKTFVLLSVSKTTKPEAEPILFKINHFRATSFDNLSFLIKRIAAAYHSYIRNITLEYEPRDKRGAIAASDALAQTIHLHFLKLVYKHPADLKKDDEDIEAAIKRLQGLKYLTQKFKVKKLEFEGDWPERLKRALVELMLPAKKLIGETAVLPKTWHA